MSKNFFDNLVSYYMSECPNDNEQTAKENVYKFISKYLFNKFITCSMICCFIFTKLLLFR